MGTESRMGRATLELQEIIQCWCLVRVRIQQAHMGISITWSAFVTRYAVHLESTHRAAGEY